MTDREHIQQAMKQLLHVVPRQSIEMAQYLTNKKSDYRPNVYDLMEQKGGMFQQKNYDVYILDSEECHAIAGDKSQNYTWFTEDYLVVGFDNDGLLFKYFVFNLNLNNLLAEYITNNVLKPFLPHIKEFWDKRHPVDPDFKYVVRLNLSEIMKK